MIQGGVLMKRAVLILLVAFLLLGIGISSNVFAGIQDFTLVNRTGVTIYNLYISPANSDDWEGDVLKDSVLTNGESIKINFSGRYETYWDIMIKDKYGNKRIWENLDLSKIIKITLYMSGNYVWVDIQKI
jgi:hypothetical protein